VVAATPEVVAATPEVVGVACEPPPEVASATFGWLAAAPEAMGGSRPPYKTARVAASHLIGARSHLWGWFARHPRFIYLFICFF